VESGGGRAAGGVWIRSLGECSGQKGAQEGEKSGGGCRFPSFLAVGTTVVARLHQGPSDGRESSARANKRAIVHFLAFGFKEIVVSIQKIK
jgi:hypothetical protein